MEGECEWEKSEGGTEKYGPKHEICLLFLLKLSQSTAASASVKCPWPHVCQTMREALHRLRSPSYGDPPLLFISQHRGKCLRQVSWATRLWVGL